MCSSNTKQGSTGSHFLCICHVHLLLGFFVLAAEGLKTQRSEIKCLTLHCVSDGRQMKTSQIHQDLASKAGYPKIRVYIHLFTRGPLF